MNAPTRRQWLRGAAALGLGRWLGPAGAATAPAAGTALAEHIRQRLSDAPVQRGEFEQRKTVKGFRHPLVSRGDYLFARDRGVVWRTREPFASTLVLTRDRLVSRAEDGRESGGMDTRQTPALRAVNGLLFALLSADLAALAERFTLDGEAAADGPWRLRLSPRDPALAAWVQRIEMAGDRQVQTVRWLEPGGEQTDLRFSAQSGAARLEPQEAARFD